MPTEQIAVGVLWDVLCLLGIWHTHWFLAKTSKGRTLVRMFGEAKAVWVFRGVLAVAFVLGLLLATDVIRPIHW